MLKLNKFPAGQEELKSGSGRSEGHQFQQEGPLVIAIGTNGECNPRNGREAQPLTGIGAPRSLKATPLERR